MAVFWLVLQTWRPYGPLNGGVLAGSTNMAALRASEWRCFAANMAALRASEWRCFGWFYKHGGPYGPLNGGVLAGSTNMAALRASEWWCFG